MFHGDEHDPLRCNPSLEKLFYHLILDGHLADSAGSGQNNIFSDGIRSPMRKQNFNLYFNDQPVLRKTVCCKFVREGMTSVRSDGKVCPCMALLHNGYTYMSNVCRKITHCSFGNIKERPLGEIWSSEEYKAFRRKFDDFEFAACLYCGHCELFAENWEDSISNTILPAAATSGQRVC